MRHFFWFGCSTKRRLVANEFSTKLLEIVNSDIFCVSDLTNKNISLSQAFLLLWQDWFTGEVDGLWSNSSLLAAAYSCILLELIALGKITIKKRPVFGGSTPYVKVVDRNLTNSHVDEATFRSLVNEDPADKEPSLVKRISRAAKCRWRFRRNCAMVILESLDKMKILKKEKKYFGLRQLFRTINLEPHGLLEKEIRLIALRSKPPDCYMRILLTLGNMADSYASKSDKLLKRHFTKNEYINAAERINNLTREWSPVN